MLAFNQRLSDHWPELMTFANFAAPATLTPPAGTLLSPTILLSSPGAAMVLAMALLSGAGAHAQAASAAPAAAEPAEPRYTAAQIAQAFSFIDGNKDGKLSREEAAGFRGVARHFDEADLNKDGVLSRREFESALSSDKNR